MPFNPTGKERFGAREVRRKIIFDFGKVRSTRTTLRRDVTFPVDEELFSWVSLKM
jgi:hypothetical protein